MGPGLQETEERDESWSSYEPGDPWGPGIPVWWNGLLLVVTSY